MSRKVVSIPLFLAILLRPGGAQIGLHLSPSSQSVNQPSNQQFVVTCEGQGAEPSLFSNVRWRDPRDRNIDKYYSERINADIRVEEVGAGRVLLHFQKPIEDDSGQYTCFADFQHSDSLENKIQINFFRDVTWEDCPKTQFVVLGAREERVRCRAVANPKPNIFWMKNGNTLTGNRFQIDSNGLTIAGPVLQTDGGEFGVRALVTETGRLHETLISVQVFTPPEIQSLPERVDLTEGQEATVQCQASGNPPPMITWLDGRQRNLSHVGGYHVDRNTGALIISRAKRLDDSGLFTCVAENFAGISRKSLNFEVWVRPEITSFENRSFEVNSRSELECRARGHPLPDITIRRDGDSRALTAGDPRVLLNVAREEEESVLRLVLTQTRRQDDGLYFCRATNKALSVERSGHLEVRFAPDMSRTPLTSVKHWELNPVNITCIADAIPNATIRWFFRGLQILPDDIFSIDDRTPGVSRLHINVKQSSQRDIYGQFRCEALNSLGANQIRIQLDQAFRPGAVLQATHERITATSVTFRVVAPSYDGGLPITAIHVQYSAEDWHSVDNRKWPLADTYLLEDLRPRTRYSFRFAAENAVGVGDWSVERHVTTERESRPERPLFRNLQLEGDHVVSPFADQYLVTWSLPSANGREIRSFEIKYFSVQKSEFGFERVGEEGVASVSMSDESMTSYTLHSSQLVVRTADKGLNESLDPSLETSTASPSLALVSGLILLAIIVLLLATDAFFFVRFKVGIFYFLTQNAFKSRDIPQRQFEPFVGHQSSV